MGIQDPISFMVSTPGVHRYGKTFLVNRSEIVLVIRCGKTILDQRIEADEELSWLAEMFLSAARQADDWPQISTFYFFFYSY